MPRMKRTIWCGLLACAAVSSAMAQSPGAESKSLGMPAAVRRGAVEAATEPARPSGLIGSTILPLAGVLGLAVVGGRLIRSAARRSGSLRSAIGAGGRAPSGILEVIGRYPVSRGATLVLLKMDTRILLLSQTAGGRFGAGAGFATLAEITDPEEVASILIKSRDAEGDSLAERFRSMLHRFDRQMEPPAAEGGRNNFPIIDLTKREPRATGPLKARLARARTGVVA